MCFACKQDSLVLVRITVRIIAWASEKDITKVQMMQITRHFRWLELLKSETYEISARDLQKHFRVFKIEIPSCELILVSPICSHSLVTKYSFIWGIPSKNNCVAFCNAFPKNESSSAREENTILTHHNQLSLPNKSCWDCSFSISNWRLLTIMPHCQISHWGQGWQGQQGQ